MTLFVFWLNLIEMDAVYLSRLHTQESGSQHGPDNKPDIRRNNWNSKKCHGSSDLWENYQETLSIKREMKRFCVKNYLYLRVFWRPHSSLQCLVSTLYSMAAIHFKLLVKFSYFSIICQQELILIQPHPCSINISVWNQDFSPNCLHETW